MFLFTRTTYMHQLLFFIEKTNHVFIVKPRKNRFSNMTIPLVRIKQGAVLLGVCKGLEVSGRGSASSWRILFVVSTLIIWLPAFIYAGMAIAIPVKENEEDANNSALENEKKSIAPNMTKIEGELERLQNMKEKGLITDEEYSKMRQNTLQL